MSPAIGARTLDDTSDMRGIREKLRQPAEDFVRIGHVVSVSGSHAIAMIERSETIEQRAHDPRIEVGGVVRIQVPGSAVVGLISAISAPLPEMDGKKNDIGLIEINLTGEIRIADASRRGVFRRGVSALPSLGDPVAIADKNDLACIFAPPSLNSITIGTLYQDPEIPARLLADELLRKHFIVVGSTGSGKSCALTNILRRLLALRSRGHVVILDVHNEYGAAFGDMVERISLEDFNLPLWMLNFHELCAALTGDDSLPRGRGRDPQRSRPVREKALCRGIGGPCAGAQVAGKRGHDRRYARAVPRIRCDCLYRQRARQARTHAYRHSLSPPQIPPREPGRGPALQVHVRQRGGAGYDDRRARPPVPDFPTMGARSA